MFFFSPIWYIGAVLAVNGIMHGAVWCGSVFAFGKYLSQKTMNGALLFMSVGFAVGNALSFGISALAASLGNWRISFIVFGSAFLVSTLYFLYSLIRVEKAGIKPTEDHIPLKKQVYKAEKSDVKPLLIMSNITVFFACVLYYGFTNWMPTILKDVFALSNADANLITVLFPILVFIGPVLGVYMCNKLKNDFLVTLLCCFIGAGLSLTLYLVFRINIVLTVAVISALGIFLRCINNVVASLVPMHTREYVNAGRSAAVINAVACVAAAISPFLISFILDVGGNDWGVNFLVLFAVACVTLIVSIVFFIIPLTVRRGKKAENDAC